MLEMSKNCRRRIPFYFRMW